MEGQALRDKALSAKDSVNGRIGNYTDAELAEKMRIVQVEGGMTPAQSKELIKTEALGFQQQYASRVGEGLISLRTPDGNIDWNGLEKIQFGPGDTAAGRLKIIRDNLLRQVVENPFSADAAASRIQRGLDDIFSKVSPSERGTVMEIIKNEADVLCYNLQRSAEKLPRGSAQRDSIERQLAQARSEIGKITQQVDNSIVTASSQEGLIGKLSASKVRPDIINELRTLDIKTGSSAELRQGIKQAETMATRWKANMPQELHADVDTHVSALVREKTDVTILSMHRIPSDMTDMLKEAGQHGYKLSPETITRSQLSPDGKRILTEGRAGLDAMSQAMEYVGRARGRMSELR
ncbi:MAG TPA: hypothetical protein PK765_01470 [bacterium]|nr:hypothetical protein [bacterium]